MLELDQDLFFYSEQRQIKILGLNFISFLKKISIYFRYLSFFLTLGHSNVTLSQYLVHLNLMPMVQI